MLFKEVKFVSGDEIFSINGTPVQGMAHAEAIALFKEVKQGSIVVVVGRRQQQQQQQQQQSLSRKKSVNFAEEWSIYYTFGLYINRVQIVIMISAL